MNKRIEQPLPESSVSSPARVINRTLHTADLVLQRLRASLWRVRGARLSAKVMIGSGVMIREPSSVTLMDHVTVESQVWLKVVDHRATI
ncbi:hypothetical protein SV7mr_33300 [Stieleria bergensis]|uniref:Uncharacterized protein n=1 Tax=Stieleria bergensis TaxID=2528025 RepID=A0A517SXN4_9BACT|nr:hypothetical protein SV7mr_33300 [Planctomycetes bacterium SV_7m_r]